MNKYDPMAQVVPSAQNRHLGRAAASNRRLLSALLFLLVLYGASVLAPIVLATLDGELSTLVDPAAATLTQTRPPAGVLPGVESGQAVSRLQSRLRIHPEDTRSYAALGLAYLQLVRETFDASLYAKAEQAFAAALARDPEQPDALVGRGSLALAQHRFADALVWGERARAANPYRSLPLGILTDAHIELGQYDEAAETLQRMLDMHPDQSAFSRVAYLRELHGDVDGAIEAMGRAVAAGAPAAEGTRWCRVQLGNLYLNRADRRYAQTAYEAVLRDRPDDPFARAGMARIHAADGDLGGAIRIYEPLVQTLPLPQFALALGELYDATGQTERAKEQYDLVRTIQALSAGGGVDVDLELALFEADHGSDFGAALNRARAAFDRRPSIYAADVLAWALYRNGEAQLAAHYSDLALRLGTRDALLYYHAGMIAAAAGQRTKAVEYLTTVMAINPAFGVRDGAAARQKLRELDPLFK